MLSKAITIEKVKDIVESTGAKLISKEYFNNHTKIEFLCSNCGNPGSITWKQYCRGQNHNFLCPSCISVNRSNLLRNRNVSYTIEELQGLFSKKGATLLSTEYKSDREALDFLCSSCGKPWKIRMAVYKRGENQDLLCQDCYLKKRGSKKLSLSEVQKYFLAGGSELLSKKYFSVDQKLEYKCIYCGGTGVYTLDQIRHRSDEKRFLCNDCLHGQRLKPQNNYGHKHHLYDLQWFSYIYSFYNLPSDVRKLYSAHHIKMYKNYPDYRTSFCNGYPILTKYHDLGAIDPITGKKNQFHVQTGYSNPLVFPEYAKLPYHTYPDFRFLDLNSVLITEIIAPVSDMSKTYLVDKFKKFSTFNILYLPFFFDELFVSRRLVIACSIVRRVLYNWFPDIYKYTGQNVLYASKVDSVQLISGDIVKDFYKENSLFGFISSELYLGVFYNKVLCGVMSFNMIGETAVISNYVERCNIVCLTGMQSCFNFILDTFTHISQIQFSCDLRFNILYERELKSFGFMKINQSEPNRFYMSKVTNRFFKEMKNTSDWLNVSIDYNIPIEKVKDRPSEEFIEVYDLGECNYVWKKTE